MGSKILLITKVRRSLGRSLSNFCSLIFVGVDKYPTLLSTQRTILGLRKRKIFTSGVTTL